MSEQHIKTQLLEVEKLLENEKKKHEALKQQLKELQDEVWKSKSNSFCWLPPKPNGINSFRSYSQVQLEFTRAKVAIQ